MSRRYRVTFRLQDTGDRWSCVVSANTRQSAVSWAWGKLNDARGAGWARSRWIGATVVEVLHVKFLEVGSDPWPAARS